MATKQFLTDADFEDTAPLKPVQTGVLGRAGDLGLSAIKSAISVPEMAVGLANLVSGGKAGKAVESAGVRFKDAKQILDDQKSVAGQLAQRRFDEAEGFTGKLGAAVENPSLIANTLVESAAPMFAGGVVGRGLMAIGGSRVAGAAGGVGPALPGAMTRAFGDKAASIAGAAGEGIIGAGSASEQIRQESADGELSGKQAALAGASGLATGLLGYGGGKLANRFGVGDIDTALAGGARTATAQAGKEAPGMLKRVGGGALSEGVFEELPQSVSEQMLQNVALDRDPMQGVDAAAAMGLLSGGVMGGGMGVVSGQPKQQPAATPAQPPVQSGPVVPGAPVAPATPAQRMGIDPAAGALSAAAAVAVNNAEIGSASLTEPSFAERKSTLFQQASDQETRDKIRARFGDQGLNEFSYYLNAANRTDVPQRTLDNMLTVAERMLSDSVLTQAQGNQRRAIGSNAPSQGALGGIDPTTGQPAIGVDMTPSGRFTVGPDGTATAETRVQRGDAQRRADEIDGLGMTPIRGKAPQPPLAISMDTTPSGRMVAAADGTLVPETRVQQSEAQRRAQEMQQERDALGQQEGKRSPPEAPLQPIARTITGASTIGMLGRASDTLLSGISDRRVAAENEAQRKAEEDQRRFEIARSGTLLSLPAKGSTLRPLSVEDGMNLIYANANGRALIPQEKGFLDLLRKEMGDDAYGKMAQVAAAPFLFKKQARDALIKPNKAAIEAWDASNASTQQGGKSGLNLVRPSQPPAPGQKQPTVVPPAPAPVAKQEPFKPVPVANKRPAAGLGVVTPPAPQPPQGTPNGTQAAQAKQTAPQRQEAPATTGVGDAPDVQGRAVPAIPVQRQEAPAGAVSAVGQVEAKPTPTTPPLPSSKASPAPEAGPTNQGATNGQGQETLLNAVPPTGARTVNAAPVAANPPLPVNADKQQPYELSGIDPLGWNPQKLSDTYDMQQLNALYKDVQAQHSNRTVDGAPVDERGFATSERLTPEGKKKHDALKKAFGIVYDRNKQSKTPQSAAAPVAEPPASKAENLAKIRQANQAGKKDAAQSDYWSNPKLNSHEHGGRADFKAGKPRTLPGYFTDPRGGNAKAWLRGWDKAKADSEMAPSKDAAPAQPPAPAQQTTGRKPVGKNEDGKQLEQDERGVRSYVEDGIRITEPVAMRPGRAGVSVSVENRRDEFKTVDELGQKAAAPTQSTETLMQAAKNNGKLVVSSVGDKKPAAKPVEAPAAQPPDSDILDAELSDALGKLGDVLGDVFGAKLNVTGPQYTAGDLLPALSKVVELLVKKGLKSFSQSIGKAAQLMRADQRTAAHVDSISPRQWKAAYNAIAEGFEGTDSEDAINALKADDVLAIVAPKAAPAPGAQPRIEGAKPSLDTTEGRHAVANLVSEHLMGDNKFATITEARKFIADKTGSKVEPGSDQAKRADEAIELGVVIAARDIVESSRKQGRSDEVIYKRLENLYEAQPSLNVRDSVSLRNQAYSTPVPLAFVASRLARITPEKKVGEPTAGNGALMMEANPATSTVNEIQDDRLESLRVQGFNPTQNDAAVMAFSPKSLDSMVMNPPFGQVNGQKWTFGDFTTGEIDHAIVMNSLKALKDDGDAVLIIGGTLAQEADARKIAYRGKAKREFFFTLYGQYNVVDHFTVSGDLYKKQGAAFPVDVLVIRGRGKSARDLPAAQLPQMIDTWAQLKEKLNEASSVGTSRAGSAGSNTVASETGTQPAVVPGDVASAPGVSGQRGGRIGSDASVRPADGGRAADVATGAVGATGAANIAGQRGNADAPAKSGNTRRDAAAPDSQQQGGANGARSNQPSGVGAGSGVRADSSGVNEAAASGRLQVKYANFSGNRSVNTLVATNHLSAIDSAFTKLKERVGDIDEFVRSELQYEPEQFNKSFSAEQVEALALAIDNIGQGKGFIIGDQTGIGKGRVVAAMIRYAKLNGKTPVFVTQMPDLYGDMMRDLNDIGMGNTKPLMTNNNASVPLDAEALSWFSEKQGIQTRITELLDAMEGVAIDEMGEKATTLPPDERARSIAQALKTSTNPEMVSLREEIKELKASMPERRGKFLDTPAIESHEASLRQMVQSNSIGDHDVIFTTYNQMAALDSGKPKKDKETGAKKPAKAPVFGYRSDFLNHFVNANSMLILDESHNAGEAGDGKFPKVGDVVRRMIAKSGGVFYSSATFAKNTAVMDVYSKTDLGSAFDTPADLVSAINSVPMQQITSSMLVEAGQYLRRERSFDGIEYKTETVEVDQQAAEDVARAMRLVVDFDAAKKGAIAELQNQLDQEGAVMAAVEGGGSMGSVDSMNFTSVMHNVVNTFLLALKADAAAKSAIDAIRSGEKPVITVANTMEMFITEFAKDAGLGVGDKLNATFADVLKRYLEKTRKASIRHPNGESEVIRLSDEQLGFEGVNAYEAAYEFIDEMDLDIPLSPIDHIKQRIEEAGFSIGEITGRQTVVVNGVLRSRNKAELNTAGKKNTIAKYNGGTLDALIINRSGSTGLSMHASETFADQRRRVMIVAQAELDINNHMQMLGRINRTGQVTANGKSAYAGPAQYGLPRYAQMTANVPIELRPAAVLSNKMAGLNANTTAGRKSSVEDKSALDFMNKYGDRVAAEMVGGNSQLNGKLGFPIKLDENGSPFVPGAISKVTGRIGLLPLAEQTELYNQLATEYGELIAQLDALGQNDLEAKTYPLDAETLESKVIQKADDKSVSPFTSAVSAEKVSMKKLGKPYPKAKVLEMVAAQLKGMDAADVRRKTLADVGGQIHEEVNALNATFSKATATERVSIQKSIDALNAAAVRFRQTLPPLGVSVLLKTDAGNMYGVVTRVERTGKAKSAGSLSAWKVQIAVVDGARSMTLPLTQLYTDGADIPPNGVGISSATEMTIPNAERTGFDTVPVIDGFDRGQTDSRETRVIITGNILRGYGVLRGRLLNYTDNKGGIKQGILMPADFDMNTVQAKFTPSLKSTKEVMALLEKGGTVIDKSNGGDTIRISKKTGPYVVEVSKTGLGKKLAKNAGDLNFVSSGNKMRVRVWDAEVVANFLDKTVRPEGIALVPDSDSAKLVDGVALSRTDESSRTASPAPRTPASTIRSAITKAYGNLLDKLEAKGLVTIAQTEREAIEAAAQARADKTGGDVEQIKRQMLASMIGEPEGIIRVSTINAPNGTKWVVTRNIFNGKDHLGYFDTEAEANEYAEQERTEAKRSEGKGARWWVENHSQLIQSTSRGRLDSLGRARALKSTLDARQSRVTSFADGAGLSQIKDRAGFCFKLAAEASAAGVGNMHIGIAENDGDPVWHAVVVRDGEIYDPTFGRWFAPGVYESLGFRRHTSISSAAVRDYIATSGGFAPDAGRLQLDMNSGGGSLDPNSLDVKRSSNGNIEGFFDRQTGKSFLVADNLTAASAPGTLMHEVGIHMAAGGKMEALFKRAGSILKSGSGNAFIQRVKARMARAGETSDEEAAAYIVTEYENDRAKAPITIGKWLADLTSAVRAWLFSKGIILKADQLTIADIAAVARANARSMARGGPNGGPGGGQSFSKTPDTRPVATRAEFTGKRSPLTGKPTIDLFDADGSRIETSHIASTTAEALENYRLRPERQAAAQASAPVQTYAIPEAKAKDQGSNWRRVRGQEFASTDESDEYLYHVTSEPSAKSVRTDGLVPNSGGMFGGFYANYSAGKVFLTERGGVSYWMDKVGQQLESAMDNPPPVVVLRIPKSKIKASLQPDVIGGRDANAPAFYATETVFSRSDMPATIEVDGKTRSTMNSNGQPIHPTLDGVRNFWKWFGDSRVVDAQGRPKVVYHGTDQVFTEFRRGEGGTLGDGIYLSGDKDSAAEFGNVMEVYVKIENPATEDEASEVEMDYGGSTSRELQKRGFDGVDAGWEVVAFEPTQIKSATGNTGAFSAADPDIRFSRGGGIDHADLGTVGENDSPSSNWDAPLASSWDDKIYKLQDKNIDTKRVIQAIKKMAGDIQDKLNVYLQEELYHGRTAKRVLEFGRGELNPALDELAAMGYSIDDLEEYMHARHAPEANVVLAARNPTREMIDTARAEAKADIKRLKAELSVDGVSKDEAKALKAELKKAEAKLKSWTGVAAFKGTEEERNSLSGMKTEEAEAYFRSLPAEDAAKLKKVAEKMDAIMAETSGMMVAYHLESQETVDGWNSMYRHYIPLHREGKDDGSMGTGQGFSIKGREVKGRTGSKRKVVNIVAHIAEAREKTIVRGEKNRIAQALVGLVTKYPNADFWKTGAPPSERVFDRATGKVKNQVNPAYKSLPNVVMAKIMDEDGKVKEVAVTFNEGDDRAVRMAGALKNLDTPQIEGWLGTVSKATRYFAAVNTQYNPIFGVVNLVRDVQGAMINLGSTPLADQKLKIARDSVDALAGIYRDIRATRRGEVGLSKWSELYEQFQHDGGQTGFRNLFETTDDRSQELKDRVSPTDWAKSPLGRIMSANGKLTKQAQWMRDGFAIARDWLSDYNETMESATRLATYKAALDKGMTREQAASLAKNITVNFNRKGTMGTQAGALYAFFNAAMQGTARMGETLVTMEPGKPKTMRLSPFGKKVVYGGVLLGAIQALALAAGGFGDEEPPDFERERNLLIPTGWTGVGPDKGYIKIPMPLGLHVIPGIGRMSMEFALSGGKDPAKAAIKFGSMMAAAFNPIGNAGLSMQTIAPTVLDPLAALVENKDWTGKSIARESFNKDAPMFSQHKDSATFVAKFLAELVNYATGGNEYVGGALNWSPDQIDYLIGQVTGGVGRELSKVEQTATGAFTGDETPIYKVPLLGRFAGSASGKSGEANAFYTNADKLNRLETELKGMQKDGKAAEAAALRMERPESRMIVGFNMAERQVQKLRKQKSALIEAGASAADVRAVDERITAIMQNMNQRMLTVSGA